MTAPPPPELIDRFRRDLAALSGMEEPLGVAVSGGPDSLALLLLAAAALPGRVAAATVDHGLRPESAAEAALVGSVCERLGCAHATLTVPAPVGPDGLQAEARRVRYEALALWAVERGLHRIATAHHADDQAETVLMRLARGAGIGGLSGIRPIRRLGAVAIVRPLLGWSKVELRAVVDAAGIEPADDPSNRDPRFDRSAVRALLAANPQLRQDRLARSAAACGDADQALDWAAEQLIEDRLTTQLGEWRLDPTGLPRELRRRLLARAVEAVREAHDLPEPRRAKPDLDRLLAALEAGETATLAGVLARGGAVWHFRLAPPRRAP